MFHFLETCRHLFLTSSVDNHRPFGTEALGRADRVHRRVAAADDSDALALLDGSITLGVSGIHQVHTRQVLIRRHDTHEVLARDTHEVRKPGATGDEDATEAVVVQVVVGERLPDDAVRDEVDTHAAETVDLDIHDTVREAELRYAILQHAPYFMQSLEHRNVIPTLGHLASKRQPGGAGADHGDLDTVGGSNCGDRDVAALALVVGGEALQIANSDSLLPHFEVDTLALALLLLRADTATDGREGAGFLQHAGSLEELSAFDILDKGRDMDTHRAALHTRGLGTVEATLSLAASLLGREAEVHFLKAGVAAVLGVELGHFDAGYIRPFLILHAFAKLLPPRLGTAGGD